MAYIKPIKIAGFISIILLISSHFVAQNLLSFYPFKGFNVGITGQAEYIQKCSFVTLTGSDPAPRPRWTYGWETGIEFSYHFAKYFGISFGIKVGTILSFNYDVFLSTIINIISRIATALFPLKMILFTPNSHIFTHSSGKKRKSI